MIKRFLKKLPMLLLILLISFVLRIVNISDNPSAMYGDELTMLLDVNSILNSGYDTTGKFLPLNFTMGGGRPVGYGYFSLPFVALFGLSALGIRLLSVISGVGIVWLVYLLSKRLFSKQIGLLSAFFLAISPWDLSMSRGGFESHFALFLGLVMIVSFLYANKKTWFYIISALGFGLSINSYSTYKFTLPVFLPLLVWFGGIKQTLVNVKTRAYLLFGGLILFLFMLLLFFQAVSNNSESRFLSINIFSDNDIKTQVDQRLTEQNEFVLQNNKFTKLLHNRLWEYGLVFGKNYLNNFSPSFLFLEGDKNPRQNMTGMGELYIVQLILIFFGIGSLFKNKYSKEMVFLITWLFIAPIPASLIKDPHALRSSFMLPPLIILSALGLYYLWTLRKIVLIKALFLGIIFGLIIQFIFIVENLYFISPNKYSRFWSYPAKLATEIALVNQKEYKYIFISDRIDNIEFAYTVYAGIDLDKVSRKKSPSVYIGEYEFRKYDNVYLGPIPDSAAQKFLDGLSGSIMYIGPANDARYLSGGYSIIPGKDKQDALVIKVTNK